MLRTKIVASGCYDFATKNNVAIYYVSLTCHFVFNLATNCFDSIVSVVLIYFKKENVATVTKIVANS